MSEQDKDKTSETVKNLSNNPNWERETLEKLAFSALKEQRAKRRWGIFFKSLYLAMFVFIFWQAFDMGEKDGDSVSKHTAVIEIDGVIDSSKNSAEKSVIPALNRAFSDKGSVGVILRINSPGGSPVQAGMINDEIVRLRQQYPEKPVYVVVHEICASGAYYVAAAADKIYVNKASIVGSIGVLINGFGFTGAMEKLGIERRLMVAGSNKGFMDPFSPQSEKHKAYAQKMLNEVHDQFIQVVRKGRGNRLKETPETFSGLFWSGAKAVEMGLADDYGTVDSVARDVLKAEDTVDYTERDSLRDKVLKNFGASVGEGAVKSATDWSSAVLK
ncbi:MAG: S49 family peptidase [Oxalobacter sp.]|nr:MAG: S49 family peptidase [Oxalobacter sp.]